MQPVEITMDQAEDYLWQVDYALEGANIRPDLFDVRDCDELAEDGITTIPSAVLSWDTSDVLQVGPDHDRFEDGILVCWNAGSGWDIAEMNADGSNTAPEPLPVPVLAPPARVVAAITAAVLGQPLTVDGEPDGKPWSWLLAARGTQES
jgi:hypothetical protein